MTTSELKIAAAPISWGVCEVPGWGRMLDPETVLLEMSELGLPTDPASLVRDAVRMLAGGATSLDALRRADVVAAVTGMLDHRARTALDREAPTSFLLPSGR